MSAQFLTALPVFNEQAHLNRVLDEVRLYSRDILVVDDGSTDGTAGLLANRSDIFCVSHPHNRGYGAALRTAFDYARRAHYEMVVTIDCDGQHEPQRIAEFVAACDHADVVSGSRYLRRFTGDSAPPPERRRINHSITQLLNERLGLRLTDGFCGFKAYRVAALAQLAITEPGYAMPIEFWVQAAAKKLRIVELAVPLIYLDVERCFGGALDDADVRLAHYRDVLERALTGVAGVCPAPWRGGELCLAEQDRSRC